METPNRASRNLHLNSMKSMCTPLKVPASPFMQKLGYGTCVNVFRLDRSPKLGTIRSPLAVKRVSQKARQDEDGSKELYNSRIQHEAEILRKLSHPNIIGFRGITKSQDGVDSLVLECCGNSLGDILEDRLDDELGPLPAKKAIKMIDDIARALDYLHTEAKLLHGDLKSYNILVKGDFEICKLCDFGVSLPLDENGEVNVAKNPHLQYVGTDVWSAPEVLDEVEIIDTKADIFSFGLIMYETIALTPPHTEALALKDDEESELDETVSDSDASKETNDATTDSSFEAMQDRFTAVLGTRPPLPQAFELSDEYNIVVELFYCCTNEIFSERPTAKIIWQSLQGNEEKNEKNFEKN